MSSELPKTPKEIRDHLIAVMSTDWFLKMQGLNNDIPFFICPYQVQYAVEIEAGKTSVVSQITRSLSQQDIEVLSINMFDLSVELIQERGIWERLLEKELSISKAKFQELLQGVVDTQRHLIPAITAKMESEEHDILMLTGIGEVFPFIRSHNVLNNLQSKAKTRPTLMMYPGVYELSSETGGVLRLFDKLLDDKYYRALNILDKKA